MNKNQKYIRNALIHLLTQKGFYAVYVNDIIKEAEVSRSTFYNYYDDKYMLLEEIETELIDGFLSLMLEVRKLGLQPFFEQVEQQNIRLYTNYFEYIKQNSVYFSCLLNPKSQTNFSDVFIHKIQETRHKTIEIWRVSEEEVMDPLIDYRVSLLATSYVSIFTTWLNNDMDLEPREMGIMLSSLWQPGFFYSQEFYDEILKPSHSDGK